MFDAIIIGAGVSGSAAARELSKYRIKMCVIEKAEDVCCGTSKANSGIVHAGYDAIPGTLMAKLNVRGNELMGALAEELDFSFIRDGSLVIGRTEEDLSILKNLKIRGEKNGVRGLEILNREQLLAIEPNISDDAVTGLFAPTAGLVCPFGLNIALAENANVNGVEFIFNTEVQEITKIETGYRLQTSGGSYEARCVVNAAGVYADCFHNMVSKDKLNITPRRGEYYLLDKSAGTHVSRTIFALPGRLGKGILVTPTVHGNLLVGPTAADIENKDGTNTTLEGLAEVAGKAGVNVKNLPLKTVITSFAGLRAHGDRHDFVIEEVADSPGFIDCAGIESPGLTSAPAIGEMIAEIIRKKLNLKANPNFVGKRKGILDPSKLSIEKRNEIIRKKPAYGNIICRCEMISEGEILDAIHRPLGARTLDGIKRRVRAGAGRCQAGFCSPKTMDILSRELEMPMDSIQKSGQKSKLIMGTNKDSI